MCLPILFWGQSDLQKGIAFNWIYLYSFSFWLGHWPMPGTLLPSGLPQIDTVLDLLHSISWATILIDSISITLRTLTWQRWQTFSLTIVFPKTSFQCTTPLWVVYFLLAIKPLYAPQLCDCGVFPYRSSFKFRLSFYI